MNILFYINQQGFSNFKTNYKLIRKAILLNNIDLTRDLYSDFEGKKAKKDDLLSENGLHFLTELITKSDGLILEVTNLTLDQLSIINLAKNLKKPALLLHENNTKLKDETKFVLRQFINEFVVLKSYFAQDLESVIGDFKSSISKDKFSRFNFMLESAQKDYLEWADRFYKTSKSDIIRDLIDAQIKNDAHYQRELQNVTQKSTL